MRDVTAHFAPIIDCARSIYMPDYVPLHAPVFEGQEKEYLNDCITSNFVSSVGAKVTEFEQQIAALEERP